MLAELVYADTSIWNELCDQSINTRVLKSELEARCARMVLGMNVFYEIVKTFGNSETAAVRRGSDLFLYLKLWIQEDLLVVRQTPEILVEEALHSDGQLRSVRAVLDPGELQRLAFEISMLASGNVGPQAEQFIQARKATAKQVRIDMSAHLESRPELKSNLRGITLSALGDWLDREARSPRAINMLSGHLIHVLPNLALSEANRIAGNLLASREYPLSTALVRNGIYLNWRLANRGSLRSDVPDDAYHVVNASYCHSFVTTEKDQGDQVRLSMPSLRVSVYDRSVALGTWLADIVQ